jgi:hypothetical protein
VISDQRNRLGVVQLEAAGLPAPREFGCIGDEQPILFMRR